jgi:hypothetical protein
VKARLAALVVLALALAGCGGIPTSGSVVPGNIFDEEQAIDAVFDPPGPKAGATPKEILEGFILAATNPQNDYDVARLFLDESIRATWDPDFIVQIRSDRGSVQVRSDTELSFTLTSEASVNARGQYSEGVQATQQLDFTVVQHADGEWRINSAPPGIVLSQAAFGTIFHAHPLYFFDPTNRFLVPDLRWFPRTTKLTNRIVSELLKGQSTWLAQGVTNTYFPVDTVLASSVSINARVATIDLNDRALEATAAERALMAEQLRAALDSVSDIDLRVNGVAIDVPDTGAAQAVIHPQVSTQLLVRRDDSFGFLSDTGTVAALPGQSEQILALGAVAATLANDRKSTAVLAPDGVHLVFENADDSLLVDARPGLIAPAIDTDGFVWTVPQSDATAIHAYDAEGTLSVIDGAQFAGQAISFSVSRDGARVLMLFATEFGPRLSVAGIVRRDGVPAQLGAAVQLPIDLGSPGIGAAWVDENTVALLAASDTEGNADVTLYTLGGPTVSDGRISGGVSIVGGNGGSNGLRVMTADGDLYLSRGNGWADLNTSVTFIGTQQ